MAGVALMALVLFVSLLFWRKRRRSALDAVAPEDLPKEVRATARCDLDQPGLARAAH